MNRNSIARRAWKLGTLCGASKNSIILTGSPRSGTTWLSEALESVPGTRGIWEPLRAYNMPEESHREHCNFGMGLRPFFTTEYQNEEFKAYIAGLLNGTIFQPGKMRGPSDKSTTDWLMNLAMGKRTLIKFCRAQRLLPWLQPQFMRKSVLLMRNPIAVIASQLHHKGFNHNDIPKTHPIVCERTKNCFSDLLKDQSIEHLEQRLAITWCLDYYVPLKQWAKCSNTLLICYEALVENPQPYLEQVEQHCGITFPDSIREQLNKPSKTTTSDSNVLQGKNPQTSWKNRLSPKQVQRITRILEAFEFDFYGTFEGVDFNALQRFTGFDHQI